MAQHRSEEKAAMMVTADKEHQLHEQDLKAKKRRKWIICGGVSAGVILLIVILIVVLALTVFKPKDPRISVDSVKLQSFNVSLNLINPRFNLVLDLWVSVYNPNRASFKYSNSTSRILYHDDQIGEAQIPAGKIDSRATEKFPTRVSIEALQIIGNSNLIPDLTSGTIPISTTTRVSGRVNVLNIFKRHATSSSVCNVTISLSSRSVQDLKCVQKTKL